MIAKWNELPEEVLEAGTIPTFKIHLNRYMDRNNIEMCESTMGKCD